MMTEASVWGLYVQENMALFMLFEASTATQSEDNGKHCGLNSYGLLF